MSKRSKKNRRSSKKVEAAPQERHKACLWLRAAPLLVVGLLTLGITPAVEAATIPIGVAPVDTCISKDGSMSFVLEVTRFSWK